VGKSEGKEKATTEREMDSNVEYDSERNNGEVKHGKNDVFI